MKENTTRGTWGVRLLIRLFTVLLGVLVYWLLGFLVEDIESIKGPDYSEIEHRHVDPALLTKKEQLDRQIADVEREAANKREEQHLIGDSAQNLQLTINQLLELQKLSIQKDVSLPETEKGSLSASLARFLDDQKSYQELNRDIGRLASRKNQLDEERRRVDEQIANQRKPAQQDYDKQVEAHHLKLAFYQLLILVPLLLVSASLVLKKRASLYFPLFLAFAGATLIKVALVVHEYFPSRYFKYILIVLLMGVVARLLVHFIRTVAFPKKDWLMRQYREAYERFLCPVCEYPIRTGPRKYLYWTRRTVHKVLPQGESTGKDAPYVCPSCGTALFEVCPSCKEIRHSMLPHCEHCGAMNEPAGSTASKE